jgi:hypothetical protein
MQGAFEIALQRMTVKLAERGLIALSVALMSEMGRFKENFGPE